jgi:hypothetical protein
MSCRKCGRGDGHYIGCEAIKARPAADAADQCAHEGCERPKKPWGGKGARPKYCVEGHKEK